MCARRLWDARVRPEPPRGTPFEGDTVTKATWRASLTSIIDSATSVRVWPATSVRVWVRVWLPSEQRGARRLDRAVAALLPGRQPVPDLHRRLRAGPLLEPVGVRRLGAGLVPAGLARLGADLRLLLLTAAATPRARGLIARGRAAICSTFFFARTLKALTCRPMKQSWGADARCCAEGGRIIEPRRSGYRAPARQAPRNPGVVCPFLRSNVPLHGRLGGSSRERGCAS